MHFICCLFDGSFFPAPPVRYPHPLSAMLKWPFLFLLMLYVLVIFNTSPSLLTK